MAQQSFDVTSNLQNSAETQKKSHDVRSFGVTSFFQKSRCRLINIFDQFGTINYNFQFYQMLVHCLHGFYHCRSNVFLYF